MKRYLTSSFRLAAGLGLVGLLLACQGLPLQFQGREVPANKRQAIAGGGPHQVRIEKRGAVIEYAYVRQGETIEIQGTVTLGRGKGATDYLLEHLYIRMYPLDNEGRVLDSHLMVNRSRVLNANQFSFERQFEVPGTTTGVAWSLWSRWSRPGSQGYGKYTVWDSPLD
jgi:hypothetical protein